MQSKRSFFNRTLFRKNLSRFWPLWGGASLVGSLLPLYMLLALLSGAGRHLDALEFSYALYAVVAAIGPALSLVYAALCAMLVWGYLYASRSVGLMHTLPVDRTCLFITTSLSGLAMMVIPYAVVGSLMCLIAAFWGFFDLIAVANTVLAVLLMTVTFFGLATFCAMLTGNIFALPLLYALINFLAPLLETLTTSLAAQFLIGSPGGQGILDFLSPVIQLYKSLSVETVQGIGGGVGDYCIRGFDVLAAYGLAGIILLALAWLLYRRRHSESAGDIAAFRILRPVFRYGLALLSALTLGRLLYELLWATLFQPGLYAHVVPVGVCMAFTGVLGYYVASMLLEKTLRVFQGSWKGIAAVCAGTVVLCLLVSVDIFGVERRVPDLDEVEWVQLRDYNIYLNYSTDADPELAQRLLDIHKTIIADRAYLQDAHDDDFGTWRPLNIMYKLKNGTIISRRYHLWYTEERINNLDTYDGKLTALFNDPKIITSQIAIPDGASLTDIMLYDYQNGYGADSLPPEDRQNLYDAMLLDAQEGNVPGWDLLRDYTISYDYYLELEDRILDEHGTYSHGYKTVYLYPTMEHTIDALLELEHIDQTVLAKWNAELAADMAGE